MIYGSPLFLEQRVLLRTGGTCDNEEVSWTWGVYYIQYEHFGL
jgi:hypothetical protein